MNGFGSFPLQSSPLQALPLPSFHGQHHGMNPDVSNTFGTGNTGNPANAGNPAQYSSYSSYSANQSGYTDNSFGLSAAAMAQPQNAWSMPATDDGVKDMEVDPCPAACFLCESTEYYWLDHEEQKDSRGVTLYFCNKQCFNQYRNRRALFKNSARKIDSGQQQTLSSMWGFSG
jgi:hypothetical protein